MAVEYERSAAVEAPPDALFAFLSDVRNLPRYFSRMVAAEPGRGAEVQTEAILPDGSHVAGKAWFEVDDAARRIDWGSEGPRDYRGWLRVSGEGSSTVEVHVSTAETEDEQVGRDIETTLENIKWLAEGSEGAGSDTHRLER